jgi:undecaprenyl-diphosphatase
MPVLLEQLIRLDRFVIEASQILRWEPLTVLFVLASAAWVKGPLFVVVGVLGDLRAKRRYPAAASLTVLSATLGSVFAFLIKNWTDRARPPLAVEDVEPLVATPQSPSFPSGHAATAFAAATVVAVFHPRLRVPIYTLAALVALSRVYLGVHFWLDILAGAALGVLVGLVLTGIARRVGRLVRIGFPFRELAATIRGGWLRYCDGPRTRVGSFWRARRSHVSSPDSSLPPTSSTTSRSTGATGI